MGESHVFGLVSDVASRADSLLFSVLQAGSLCIGSGPCDCDLRRQHRRGSCSLWRVYGTISSDATAPSANRQAIYHTIHAMLRQLRCGHISAGTAAKTAQPVGRGNGEWATASKPEWGAPCLTFALGGRMPVRKIELEVSGWILPNLVEDGASMEMTYRERWKAEIVEMRRVLAGFEMKEECKWGKPTYTVDGKNIVIMQGFKEYFGLGFFQGALLKDPKKVLVQLGQVHAGRVMKFTSVKDIMAKAATIKAYVREAIAVEKAGLRMERKKTSDFPVPEELTGTVPNGPTFQARLRGADAGAAEELPLPLCRG